MPRGRKRRRRFMRGGGALVLAATFALSAAPAQGAPTDPLFIFSPVPPPPPHLPEPLPTSYFNDPCGLAVDGSGSLWVSDLYHRSVDVFSSAGSYEGQPLTVFDPEAPVPPQLHAGPVDDPCALALDSTETLYLNNYHRNVVRFPAPVELETGAVLPGSAEATGVAVDPATDHAYVDMRDHVNEYDSSGAPVGQIGAASLEDGYGIAVSGYGPTAGYLYVPDAADDTVKVYDPATDTDNPVATIDRTARGLRLVARLRRRRRRGERHALRDR